MAQGEMRERVARIIASPLCDATKADHEVMVREGGYKFCTACGETIRKASITLFEARNKADAILAAIPSDDTIERLQADLDGAVEVMGDLMNHAEFLDDHATCVSAFGEWPEIVAARSFIASRRGA